MTTRRVSTTVRINGVITPVRSVRTIHDVDQPVGTGTITLAAPLPSYVALAAPVAIHAGYNGAAYPIFSGRVASFSTEAGPDGRTARIEVEGWGRLLYAAHYEAGGYQGPMALDRVFRGLCAWRGVPFFAADTALDAAGSPILLGSNPDIDGGWIPVPADTSAGEVLDRWSRHFGYRHFDTPIGNHLFQRVNGLPPGDVASLPRFDEPMKLLTAQRAEALDIVNYVEVKGARYKAADSSERAIRSIPATVTLDQRLGSAGVRKQTIQDDVFVTLALAAAARNAYERDLGGVPARWQWETTGDPLRRPGESVAVQSASVSHSTAPGLTGDLIRSLPVAMWLMRVEHIIETGWTTTMQGWAGYGTALPAGNDSVFHPLLGPEGRHLGTEYLSHYRRPNPDGLTVTIPFNVAANYTTLTIRGDGHGTNSFVGNTPTEASKFEIWQTVDGEYKSVASGDMPRLPENLEQRYPYGDASGTRLEDGTVTNNPDYFWHRLVIPLSGSLTAGPADLKIISGYDSAIGDYDDFEVKSLVLETGGVGTPTFA